MRYLVVIPPHERSAQARYREYEAGERVAAGDELLVDDGAVRVRAVIGPAPGDEYDATLVCLPDAAPA